MRGWLRSMSYGFRQYVGHQTFINSSNTVDFVFHLKIHYLVSKPLDGCIDLVVLVSDLVYCFKKCVLVGSRYGP